VEAIQTLMVLTEVEVIQTLMVLADSEVAVMEIHFISMHLTRLRCLEISFLVQAIIHSLEGKVLTLVVEGLMTLNLDLMDSVVKNRLHIKEHIRKRKMKIFIVD
jgi:hypothetical protein